MTTDVGGLPKIAAYIPSSISGVDVGGLQKVAAYFVGGQTGSMLESQFKASLLDIIGDTRVLFMPSATDTTSSTDKSRNQRSLTHNSTLVGRLGQLGNGYYASYDGSAHYSAAADADDLSWGDSSTDTAHSWILLGRITNTANNRTIFGKYTGTAREYRCYIATNDTLVWQFYDESTDATDARSSDAAVNQDAWVFLCGTFSGTDGANGMIVYQNGLAVASTAATDQGGTYTAMENLATALGIGSAQGGAASLPYQGDLALFAMCAGALTPDKVWQLRNLLNGYYGFLG